MSTASSVAYILRPDEFIFAFATAARRLGNKILDASCWKSVRRKLGDPVCQIYARVYKHSQEVTVVAS